MTSAALPNNEWSALGERIAPSLDGVHAAVVAAPNSEAAAYVALAIARVQGATRRVAIADLIGEVEPLQSLVTGDDPHGISDSFLYGVSLNKIARPIDANGAIFLMPSGTEAVANEAVYSNERWRKLAAGFHQVGALLLVVAVPDTPGFEDLCGYVGALLPVGDYRYTLPRGVPLVAPATPAAPAPVLESSPSNTGEEISTRGRERRAREAAAHDNAARQRKLVALVGLVFAIAIAIGTMWPRIIERMPASVAAVFGKAPADSASSGTLLNVRASLDSASRDSAARAAADTVPVPSPGIIAVANPEDSTIAARFAIYFSSANTREAAMPDERIRGLPSVAITPVAEGNEQWFKLTIGAYTDRGEAEALLKRMRDEKLIGQGSIVRVPYALRLEESVTSDMAPARLAAYARRGILAYALRQQNGSTTIYTGAFESPRQATLLADSMRTTGIDPVLVLRTGRAF